MHFCFVHVVQLRLHHFVISSVLSAQMKPSCAVYIDDARKTSRLRLANTYMVVVFDVA